jgi:3-hydroxyisobutyrate dehydrogenase-like beta-hydroxyacid dehydrogenase
MNIALIGLGEVGRVLAEDLADGNVLSTWDIAFMDSDSRAARNASELPVRVSTDAPDAVRNAQLVISAVTAANDLSAAGDVASAIDKATDKGVWFLDLNSASPGQKQQSAALIDAVGGRYVEAAVLSPIHPKRIGSPLLLGGPHASDFVELAHTLGFAGAEFFAPTVGPASATKLSRSVVVKGLEALLMESMLTARTWGVEKPVLDSLSNLLPAADWPALAEYMIRRSIEHGERRSEEMVEAASTVADTGVEPLMAAATAQRQAWAAGQRDALDADDLIGLLDAIRAARTDPAADA